MERDVIWELEGGVKVVGFDDNADDVEYFRGRPGLGLRPSLLAVV